jgi:hypothetical protein
MAGGKLMKKNNNMPPRDAREEAEIFSELEELCRSPGFIHAIAYFCYRDNFIRYAGDEVTETDLQQQYSYDKLLRTEISTLIGLMAKGDINLEVPQSSTTQLYIEKAEGLLHEMHMSLQKPWMRAFDAMAHAPEEAKNFDPFGSAEGLREPIFYSAESAYYFQYEELSRLRYQADNEWLQSNFGFRIDEACTVSKALGVLQMQKLPSLHETMPKLHPEDWTFLPGFEFNLSELREASNVSQETIERVVGSFCLDPNRKNSSFVSLSAFNETNAAPILKVSDESYILLQPYSLLEALYEAPFFWMVGDKSYSATAAKNRGAFAEQFLNDRLTQVFGRKHVYQNVDIYRGKDRFAEADVLVVYGDRAIVVQAKSKRLTIEARKGNDLQLKDDFKKAIHDAYDQALLCSEALLSSDFKFFLPSGGEIKFARKPKSVFPICVVSDHFPSLAGQVEQFLKIESSGAIMPPIVSDVFFIDVMTEILASPLHILNYLTLRSRFNQKMRVSQEITILGYHLKRNLWFDDNSDWVNLADDFAVSVDIAMTARRTGVKGEKIPRGILTRFNGTPIGKLLSDIEASATPELVGVGMMLLQMSSNAAKHINNGIERLVAAASHDGRLHDMSIPSEIDKSGFTIHVSPFSEAKAKDRLSTHCLVKKYDTKSDTWYGLLLAPGTGDTRGALAIDGKWKADAGVEDALKSWPKKPMMPIRALSQGALRRKVGRNEPCPCGSGRKYKKCCLN